MRSAQLPTVIRGGRDPRGDPALSRAAAVGMVGSLGFTGVQRQQAVVVPVEGRATWVMGTSRARGDLILR